MERRPRFMLTYWDFYKGVKKTSEILNKYLARHEAGAKRVEDCFIDSGAWSIYRLHVLKTGKKAVRKGESGREVEEEGLKSGTRKIQEKARDFYNLKKGSEFRKYCNQYAEFIQRGDLQGKVRYFATVDAIGNAEITLQVHEFFEKEHGLRLIPVVHFPAPMKWIDVYLEKGYKMIGLGGMARRPDKSKVINWCDMAFLKLCPESNDRKPIVKVHGFALTSWGLLRRWPWFSVDSTSYLLYGTYGLICVPFPDPKDKSQFSFDRPPMIVSVSDRGRPVDYQTRMHISQPHGDTINVREVTARWLKHIELELKQVQESNEFRTAANLRYFMDMEQRLPRWPSPLRDDVVKQNRTQQRADAMELGI